jgi:hypothetical protein
MELIGRDKAGQSAVGEVWTRGPPQHYTTARSDEIKDPIAPGCGGDEAIRMGQTEWGEREHQDGKKLIINQDITTELSDRRQTRRPQRRRQQDQIHVQRRLGRRGYQNSRAY